MKDPNQIKHLLLSIAAVSFTVGCTVDQDVRCNFGQTPCPATFYCGGEWCYPEGAGPGLPDVATPDMSPVDMALDRAVPDSAVPDMLVADAALPDAALPDAALPDAAIMPDMNVDMAVPDMVVDMAVPDMIVDMAVPDMAVPDMAVPDMAVPDMATPLPPLAILEAAPANGILSDNPGRRALDLTIGGLEEGALNIVLALIAPPPDLQPHLDELDAADCIDAEGEPLMLRFQDGRAPLTVTRMMLQPNPGPRQLCIIDPRPGGSIATMWVSLDEDAPRARFEDFETNADRVSGVLPVTSLSADVDTASLELFDGPMCMRPNEDTPRRVDPDNPAVLLFDFEALEVGPEYTISVRATDAAENTTCFSHTFQVDSPPSVQQTAFFCESGLETEIELEIVDDSLEALTIDLLPDTDCEGVNFDDQRQRLSLDCRLDCTIELSIGDAAGTIFEQIAINAFDPNAPRFRTPLALSYGPGEATFTTPVASAAHTTRAGVSTVIVSGRHGNSSRMTQWRESAEGWLSNSYLNLAGKIVAGALTSRDPPNTFMANIVHVPGYQNEGCAAVVLPTGPYSMADAVPIDSTACAVREDGNFVRELVTGMLDADAFADVVGFDNTGRVSVWMGGQRSVAPAVNVHDAGVVDVAIIAGTGYVAVAQGEMGGARLVDLAGQAQVLQPDDPVPCVASVDWLADGVGDVAVCMPGGVMVHLWDGATFGEPQFVPVDLGDAELVDIIFERADHPQPSAMLLDSQGRVGILDATGVTLWDMAEPMRRLIDLDPTAEGFDVGLVGRDSSRLTWMLSDPDAGRAGFEPIENPDMFPQTARPVAAGDLTGDFVDEIAFIPVAGGVVQIGDAVDRTWRSRRVLAANVTDDRIFAIGDFNADGRTEGAVIRRLDDESQVLTIGRTSAPTGNQQIRFPREVVLSVGDEPAPWGMAVGPLDPNSRADLIAVGVGTELRIFQADYAAGDALPVPLGLVTTIPNVTPSDEMAIGDVGGVPGVILFSHAQVGFTFETWSLDGMSLGQGAAAATLELVKTANISGRRLAFFGTRNANSEFELREIGAMIGGEPVVFNVGELDVADFAIGDTNGDQVAELIVAVSTRGRDRSRTVRTYGHSDGELVELPSERFLVPGNGHVDGVFIGDFDGDRRPDRAVIVNFPDGIRTMYIVGNPELGEP